MEIAQRLVALLEAGRRNSTYKLATLMAMIDICVENTPAPDGTLAIPIRELAHRVIGYYWRQVRPFGEHGMLHQMLTSQTPAIPVYVAQARDVLLAKGIHTPEAAYEIGDNDYRRTVRKVEVKLAQNPLTYLQTPNARTQAGRHDFLYDARAIHNKMSRAEIESHGPIVLRPGVPQAMREFAPLIRPVIEMMWINDVAEWNRHQLETDDLASFLFGSERVGLTTVAPLLREMQESRCFYCDDRLKQTVHVDHVLPWSKIPIDGVANFVVVDARCNLAKSATLPIRDHVDRALERSATDLRHVANRSRMPMLLDRTRRAATGIYGSLPRGVPLWAAPGDYRFHGDA